MHAAGAPARYIVVNFAALIVGCVAAWLLKRAQADRKPITEALTVVVAIVLLATALAGPRVNGASRWIPVAGISIQPSLMLLPAAMMLFARNPSWPSSIALLIAGIALALQPDRAMAGALAAGLAVLRLFRRDASVTLSLLVATCAFAATLARSDDVPPVAFVENVVQSAFAFDALAGVAIVAALALMLMPAAIGIVIQRDDVVVSAVFGATWLAVIAFAIVGNYPTPLVGYGTSGIVGYCLSSALLVSRR
jgi:hypothetical protein